MAFSDFRYPDVVAAFGLTERSVGDLFGHVPPVPLSPELTVMLPKNARVGLSINTEKSRSEWLIAPLLGEFFDRHIGFVNVHSGNWYDADPAAGLCGYCDFLLGHGPQSPAIVAPVLVVFEAKNENIFEAYGQCIAGMVGTQRFNRRNGRPTPTVYGCSTIGSAWRFLQLTDDVVSIDLTEYGWQQADRILGILTHMLGPLPVPA